MTDDVGVIAAALTPRGKKGDLDFGAAFEQVDHLCAARVRGIAFFTPAGEYPAFGIDERTRLVYLAAKRSRVPVYAAVGSMSLDDSVILAREAQHAGAAGVFIPPPHFFRYSQDEVAEFYRQFAAQVRSDDDLFIANTPDVTSPVESETARQVLATGRFAGLVDPGIDAPSYATWNAAYISSDESRIPQARASGARGILSVSACAVPELVVALDTALCRADQPAIERLHAQLHEFLSWCGEFPYPALLKVAASVRGLKLGAPSIPLSSERQRKLDEFRRWFESWLPSVKK
jgi:4-hydroxy-tetrahydrodipicolinate synthase